MIKQKMSASTGDININTAWLKIRNFEHKFRSDYAWMHFVRLNGAQEEYMSQDLQRWRNQNFACTVYNSRY